MRTWSTLLGALPPPLIYAVAIGLEKAVSLITIPLLATYVPPGVFGRYDVAVSLIEFISIVVAFGLVETLVRYASTAESEAARARHAAEMLGNALLMALVLGSLFQLATPWLAVQLHIEQHTTALHFAVAAATVIVLIDMPIIWLRLHDRCYLFLLVQVARAFAMAFFMWIALANGFGADGVLVSNALVTLAVALVLVIVQTRETGIRFAPSSIEKLWRYGLPILGAGLAMFTLGNLSRWFLPGEVSDAEIAYFGVAMRLASVLPFALSPLVLWWEPRRIAMLSTPQDLAMSARVWGLSFAVLALGALLVVHAGPLFVHLAMPASYARATVYIPFVVVAIGLHQVCQLSNVGCYAKSSGRSVLLIDTTGALVALLGYLFLVPAYGVPGAITGMIAGHVVRLALYLAAGAKIAPIPYPFLPAVAIAGIGVLSILLAPDVARVELRALWAMVSLLACAALALYLGLVEIPLAWRRRAARALGR